MWAGLVEYQNLIKSILDKQSIDSFYLDDAQQIPLSYFELLTLYAIDLMIVKKALMDAITAFNLIHLPYECANQDALEDNLIYNQHQDFMVLQSHSFLAQIDNIETLKLHLDVFEMMLQTISFDFFSNWVERVVVHEAIPHIKNIQSAPFWVLSSSEPGTETDYTDTYIANEAF